MSDGKTEVRFEIPLEELAILDAFCVASGESRTSIMRELLAKWSRAKAHEATLICRVAGINPTSPEGDRK